ncbi:uncharacterized protein (DUF1697 family) [Maribacter vaceletii]|uniref:Uncharacterized protein (DUF1697 family) n=1 Tax=Maribacter vaceletii TaxID=1206816 RepID=A0A495EGS0_9FLAO|nr:DUF1697 domain-containing protein [Maribacter vaceletii]RKR15147.1 uncharacterized protein (DUF1697 family) [Maribacter vaceletii]
MKTYIALLRGINVSGKKKIIMANLRLLLEKNGFNNVQTYIQSGNIVFNTSEENKSKLEDRIAEIIKKTYDFEVPVVVKTGEEIQYILTNNPYKNPEDLNSNKIYFVLLKEESKDENKAILNAISFANETLVITPNCVYLRCALGAGKAKCTNNLIEKKLKVSATTRNYKTMLKLQEMALV